MKNGYMTFITNHIKPQRYYQILSTISKWVFMMFLLRFALSFTFATLYPKNFNLIVDNEILAKKHLCIYGYMILSKNFF